VAFLPVAEADLSELERRYLLEAFDSGFLSGAGPFVQRFEQAFADRVGAKHAVACSNGTVSLHLALTALGVGPGDEVIVPDLTYVATANAVSYCGATPVFADVEPGTWCLSARTVEPLLCAETAGIIPVHLYGHPCQMSSLGELADEHGLFLLEDAAQAHGAYAHERPVGSIGTAGSFSFYGNKILTTGEGGMVCTNDAALDQKMRHLRGHCMDPERRYWFTELGYNYRMPNLCAAVGLGQVERLPELLRKRAAVAAWYENALLPLPVQLPPAAGWAEPVYWLYSILLPPEVDRDALLQELLTQGIDARPFFASLSELPFHREAAWRHPLPVTSRKLAARGINLPTGGHVSRESVGLVAEALHQLLRV
jgi:perosamine synthetase